MKTNQEIESEWNEKPTQKVFVELLLDCRSLLVKLVENTEPVSIGQVLKRTKTISTEVPLTAREQEVLNSIEL